MDADEVRPKGQFVLGEDLYDFSVADLEERLEILREEIARVEQAKLQKRQGLDAAAAIFGKS